MIRAMWCGNVMGDMDSRQSASFFTSSSSPTLPPIKKVICVLPCTPKSASRRLSSSLEQGLPSMHSATTAPPLGSLSRMALPSVCNAL